MKHSGKGLFEEIARLSLGLKFWMNPQGNIIIGINKPEAQDGQKIRHTGMLEDLRYCYILYVLRVYKIMSVLRCMTSLECNKIFYKGT